jgi:hypothetical protein
MLAPVSGTLQGKPAVRRVTRGHRLAGSTIENRVINSPFVEPRRHVATSADGRVSGEIEERRRPSALFSEVSMSPSIGRIERRRLREVWPHEEHDFTVGEGER